MHGDEMATGRVERPPRKRASRRSLRIAAAASATLAFALPWAALRVAPRPPAAAPQTVVVKSGKVVSGHVTVGGTPSVTTTRASGAPPVH